jgi:tartrate dehydratase beta subunit/fumarate hydratase class I family protein
LAKSLSDARKKIATGDAVRINGVLLSKDAATTHRRLNEVDPKTGAFIVQFGRKNIVLVMPI